MTAVISQTNFLPENSIISKECCCCSKNGCVKDICTEYYDSGVREMYSEMILDTFNINLKETNLIWTQYICNFCITQLKKAYYFKSNILKNYEAMIEKLKKLNNQITKEDIKTESIDFFEDQCSDDGSSEEGLYDGADKEKTTETTENRLKMSIRRTISSSSVNPLEGTCKSTILRRNSLKLISNSTIWVFHWRQGFFRCFCCKEPFSNIELLKKHTESHKIEEIERKIQISENNLVKVEVSDIICKICRQKFENLPSLINHFSQHNIIINEHILVPMKINELTCQICNEKHTNFHTLYVHMRTHYQTYICDKCGSGFYQKRYLKRHSEMKHNPVKKKKNRGLIKCNYCPEKFKQFHVRIEHMVQKHGVKKPEFSCDLCTKVYITKGILNAHIKNSHHKKGRVQCDVCFQTLSSKNSLSIHKDTHTNGLNYFCSICKKGFKLSSSLRRHVKKNHKDK